MRVTLGPLADAVMCDLPDEVHEAVVQLVDSAVPAVPQAGSGVAFGPWWWVAYEVGGGVLCVEDVGWVG
ncbi:hypothetical protein ACIQMV_19305 [Streptomyces sp. NPDC091412]|uniref:hypothetical protein n=1 Tax=Streptomyces sp. NPDC091412 TaxID=3366002 RepID=UPI00380069A0